MLSDEELENVILEESGNLLDDIESEIKYKFKRYGRLRTNRGTKGTLALLEKDLIKLEKLSKLKSTNRFGGITGGHWYVYSNPARG